MTQTDRMRTRFQWFSILGAAMTLLLPCAFSLSAGESASHGPGQPPGPATSPHGAHQRPRPSPMASAEKGTTKISIPDLELLNQDGKKIRFYSDLIREKVVAINFIFTTCTTICPPLATTFSKVQELTGDRSGRDFSLISLSVDPVTDTPARLKAWGAKFQAKPGWTLVTGPKPEMDRLLKALGAFTALKEDHSPTILIGNDAKGVWKRVYGLVPPAQLVKLIDGMIDTKIP